MGASQSQNVDMCHRGYTFQPGIFYITFKILPLVALQYEMEWNPLRYDIMSSSFWYGWEEEDEDEDDEDMKTIFYFNDD